VGDCNDMSRAYKEAWIGMSVNVDFSKGGYQGDIIEETFKQFTVKSMPFWWHFREVLRASQLASPHWTKADGAALSDDEQKELVALSLMNYAVYTGIAESLAFLEQLQFEVFRTTFDSWRIFDARRHWKATYSTLYSSFNALSNIVCIVVGLKPPLGEKRGKVWNYSPSSAYRLVNGKGINTIAEPLRRVTQRLEIRSQLDHYWLIWHGIVQGKFLIDKNFTKGYVPLDMGADVSLDVDAIGLAREHLIKSVEDFNVIYRELSVAGAFLDQYVSARGWMVDYSDYGEPHNGQRPKP